MVHRGPGDAARHADDLSNIEAGSTRVTKVDIADKLISLPLVRSIIGRILAVKADADDLSKGIHELSKITGNWVRSLCEVRRITIF